MQTWRPESVIFDLDGTLYLGDRAIPGAADTVQTLRVRGIRTCFLTNKPLTSGAEYAAKLSSLGIPAGPEDVITSVRLTRAYLLEHHPGARLFQIGEEYLARQLADAGFADADRPEETDVVVVSLDRRLDYGKLHFAYRAGLAGARLVATNPDLICPVEDGEIIDAGAAIAALEALLGRPIDVVVGKPSQKCLQTAIDVLGTTGDRVLVVGDRMETDIRMASEGGVRSALVLSGVTARCDLGRFSHSPEFVLDSVADLPAALGVS